MPKNWYDPLIAKYSLILPYFLKTSNWSWRDTLISISTEILFIQYSFVVRYRLSFRLVNDYAESTTRGNHVCSSHPLFDCFALTISELVFQFVPFMKLSGAPNGSISNIDPVHSFVLIITKYSDGFHTWNFYPESFNPRDWMNGSINELLMNQCLD